MKPLSKGPEALKPHYDVVVVGSGYGGGVSASRLARCGKSVCVLERGKEFLPGEFPDRMGEGFSNIQINTGKSCIGSETALFDLHPGKDLHVLVGCGLGGTSLINANVALEADPRVFDDPAWPIELKGGEDLREGYERAQNMLNPIRTPQNIAAKLAKFSALEKAAKALGTEAIRPPINVTFDKQKNAANVIQPGCTLCGDCCSGCNVGAKNTVQMTYLPDAINHGAEIFTMAKVHHIRREDEKWRIYYHQVGKDEAFDAPSQSITSNIVVLAAGALGSTEILLRSKEYGLKLSNRLGQKFTGNGDVLAFGYNNDEPINGVGVGEPPKAETDPIGPCIVGAIDLRNSAALTDGMIIEEGSIPGVLSPILPSALSGGSVFGEDTDFDFSDELNEAGRVAQSLLLGSYAGAVKNTQTYLVMSHDDGAGKVQLNGNTVNIDWPGVAAQQNFVQVDKKLEAATAATGGTYIKNPISHPLLGENLITVHPLGGCPMGKSRAKGVVNHKCQVYNGGAKDTKDVHDGLYVCDGSVMPRPLGVNPLLTISAISERAMIYAAQDRGWSFDCNPKDEAPERYGGPETNKTDKVAGIAFTERMTGYWSANKLGDYEAAWKEGKDGNNELSFTLHVVSDDIDEFVGNVDHPAKLSGTVTCPALSSEPLDVSEGQFNLFSIDDAAVDQRRMDYYMVLTDREGKTYRFEGHKYIHNDPGLDLWSDTTRLYCDLYDSEESHVGRGVLRIKIGDFLTQMRTMQGIGGESALDRTGAMIKFGKLFGGALFNSYVGMIAPLHRYDAKNTRKKRDLRAGDPEIFWFETEDKLKLRLARYKGGTKGPVILSHGLGVSSQIFSVDTINTNLVEYLYAAGYDCWLLDYRASIDLPYASQPYTADDISQYDYEAAIETVLTQTGAKDVQMVVHCYGATTFVMAMLRGLKHVRSAVISQIAMDVIIPWWPQRLLAHLRLPSVLKLFGTKAVDAKAVKKDNWLLKTLDRIIRIILPTQFEERSQSATSNRITMLYGSLYEHDQLNRLTYLEGLPETFGKANIAAFQQLAKIGRKKYIVSAQGEDIYRPNIKNLDLPICFIHGAENSCFSPESTKRTFETLIKAHGRENYERHVISGYGHIDCIFGKDAARDVYPHILRHLERYLKTSNHPSTALDTWSI